MQPLGCLFTGRFMIVDVETSEGFNCEEAFGSGRFQNGLVLFTMITVWVMHSHTLAFSLISTDVDHWCRKPADLNISADAWKSMAIPVEADGRHSRCTVYTNLGDPNDTTVVDCTTWDYDPERANNSIVSEWNLVCNRRSLKMLATTIFMAGALGFLIVTGYSADRFGRLPVVLGSAFVVMVATLEGYFATSYTMYVCTRFLISGSTISLYALTTTILAESCSFARRPTFLTFSIIMGTMLAETSFTILKQVPHLNWVSLQLLMVAPTLLLPVGFFLAAESPRWLIASRRLEEAERVMLVAAKLNGDHGGRVALLLQRVEQRLQAEEGSSGTAATSTDMARVVRRRAAIMFGSSFSVMLAYYSVLLYDVERRTETSWVQWAPLCASALAYCLLLKLVNRVEKTRLITSAFVILGTTCIFASGTLAVTEKSSPNVVGDISFVFAQAACCVALVFNFVYVIELFPTPVRATALCLSFAGARMGGMASALFSALEKVGREDLLFTLVATVVYCSAYSFQFLPLEYGTYARLAEAELTVTSAFQETRRSMSIEAMKKSLTPLAPLPPRKTSVTRMRSGGNGRKLSQPMSPALRAATPVADPLQPSDLDPFRH